MFKNTYNEWLNSAELTESEKSYLNSKTDEEIKEMFYSDLEFGTAGMRGVLDLGTNRMNRFSVIRATKGLAEFVCSEGAESMQKGIVISYDTRRCSTEFAVLVARVLAHHNINAYLFEDVRPVPLCSFAIRHLGARGAVMITASHNPKQYNGYKVYGEDGAQMAIEDTNKVVSHITSTPYFGNEIVDVAIDADSIKGRDNESIAPYITVIGKGVDNAYFDAIEKLSLSQNEVKKFGKTVKIVYTPIHGSGYMPVTTILDRMGIDVAVVESQAKPDGEFSTVRVPNPEEKDTLQLGVQLADNIGSDVVIGTDPDADRIGLAIRDKSGEFVLINGNQTGVLILNYLITRKKDMGILPENGAIIKTIVTTELARVIADNFGVKTFDVLTGFKFIGEKIKEWEVSGEFSYIYGFEESYGSLVGTHARDKDAVVASMMVAEMICFYESQGKTLFDVLTDIYNAYGFFVERSVSITYPGIDGMDKMAQIMLELREHNFGAILSTQVDSKLDFVTRTQYMSDGTESTISLPRTNALKLMLKNGDWICIRPSGTEPKLKIYAGAKSTSIDKATDLATEYINFIKSLAI